MHWHRDRPPRSGQNHCSTARDASPRCRSASSHISAHRDGKDRGRSHWSLHNPRFRWPGAGQCRSGFRKLLADRLETLLEVLLQPAGRLRLCSVIPLRRAADGRVRKRVPLRRARISRRLLHCLYSARPFREKTPDAPQRSVHRCRRGRTFQTASCHSQSRAGRDPRQVGRRSKPRRHPAPAPPKSAPFVPFPHRTVWHGSCIALPAGDGRT